MLTKPCFQTATSVDYDCVVYSVTRARLMHPRDLIKYYVLHFSYFFTELKFTIFPLSFDFVIADILAVRRTRNANNLAISHHGPTCSVVRAPIIGVQKIMGVTFVWRQIFPLPHTRHILHFTYCLFTFT